MINLLNLSAGERVDLADFSFVAQESLLGAARGVSEGLLTSPAKQTLWIIRGFTMSNPSGQILSVAKGAAILALRQGARILQGVLTVDGIDTASLDLSSYSGGTYNVYIRFVLTPGSFDTRTFYRASGGGAEYAQSVPTRLSGNWELMAASASPGAEWVLIGTVTTPSMATTDMRPLFFEGRVDKDTASGWGSAQDRAAGQIGDLQTALAAVRQSLEDIKGPGISRWFTDHVAGQTIGYASAPKVGRTSWGDDNFFAQGDSARPSLTFGADGAHIAYVRASGLMVATGPELGATAQSVTSALSFRSGADNALVRGGFYRALAGVGAAGIDGSLTRGPVGSATGGLGLYGAQGLMGGAGVGLGYAMGAQAPALFVNANNLVGIGHSSAATMSGTLAHTLQLNAAANTETYMAFNEAGVPKLWFGYANNVVVARNQPAFKGAVLDINAARRFLITQTGFPIAAIDGGRWIFGDNAQQARSGPALINVITTQNPITSSNFNSTLNVTITNYQNGTSLYLNNDGNSSDYFGVPLSSRIAMASSGVDSIHIDGGQQGYAVTDVVNNIDIMRYSSTTKTTNYANAIRAPNYQLTPNYTTVNSVLGSAAIITTGSAQQSASLIAAAYRTVASANFQVVASIPLVANQGQMMSNVTLTFTYNGTVNANGLVTVARYDTQGDGVFTLGTANVFPVANSGQLYTVTVNTNNEVSNTYQCWFVSLNLSTPSTSFTATIKSAQATLTTPYLSPQRQ